MFPSEQIDRVVEDIAKAMGDLSPSDRVLYLQRRLGPLFRLQEEIPSHRYDAYATEASSRDFRSGYEEGVRACEGELTEALKRLVSDPVDLRSPPKKDPDEPF